MQEYGVETYLEEGCVAKAGNGVSKRNKVC